jgi:hypothetical protein
MSSLIARNVFVCVTAYFACQEAEIANEDEQEHQCQELVMALGFHSGQASISYLDTIY